MIALSLALLGMTALGATPVVVSTDCGCEMDDQWAIAHLALSPTIDLRAIVTTHAPGFAAPAAESSATVARALLDPLPIARKPPVVAGSSEPLRDGLTANRNPGVDRLLAEAKGFDRDRRLTIVMIGPATDVASALLIDPSLADRVTVVAMAFDGWPEGGDPFNVRNDLAAWRVVINSAVPLVVADGAVTKQALTLSRGQARGRFACLSPAADALVAIQAKWLDRSPTLAKRITGSSESWPVWDEGPVAVLLGYATVETRPRPRLRDDRTLDHASPRGSIGWVTAIDGRRLWADLAERLRPSLTPRGLAGL